MNTQDAFDSLLELAELAYGPQELASARRIQFLQKHGWTHQSEQGQGAFQNTTHSWWVKGDAKEFASRAVFMQANEVLARVRGEQA